ncbi:hypothetical protein P170DRAFT_431217 [Aspergillus steynii IBT 23096]|uniref:Actin-like ATPase domain-containing protein n=1 Tax=Aspergillus steynii IBT 23096 TaxID=1392250 RepID=A0A2I2FRL8_9EURO|nr:uncharacterized protein P170DRAFT_431217 [Aspergillus steynii IBT 23096]PLB43257.1 hypothetical protein P170DRAFT_431217 [Aspergillus steynii IBT 23096]
MVFCFWKSGSKSTGEIRIGIDLGTTYTGVAFSFKGLSNRAQVIDDWPGSEEPKSKVPSTIAYQGKKISWGYETASLDEENVVRAIKLLLDSEHDTDYEPAVETKLLLKGLSKKPVDVAADYLKALVKYAQSATLGRLGKAAKKMDMKYCFTMPPHWPSPAVAALKQAIIKAGINKRTNGIVLTRIGESFGSEMLDDLFKALLIKLFGYEVYSGLPSDTRKAAMRHWRDIIKPSFGQSDGNDSTYLVPMPGVKDDPSFGVKDGYLSIERSQVQGIFDPVIEKVKNLVATQISKSKALERKIQVIALVGGFGSSKYLFHELKAAYPRLQIMQQDNAWASAARGAALTGLRNEFDKARIATRSYGILYTTRYDPLKHQGEKVYWDDLDERWKVPDRMRWFIKKGDVIRPNKRIEHRFQRIFNKNSKMSGNDNIYVCDKDTPPEKYNGNDVKKLCKQRWNFSSIPKSELDKATNSQGVRYYKVHYDIVMIPGCATLMVDDEIDGRSYGKIYTDF